MARRKKAVPEGGPDGTAEGTAKGGKKKLLIVIPLVLALAGAGVWFFLLRGGDDAPKEPVPGAVVHVENPITINLAGGHFLKLGLALQQDAAAGGGGEGGELDTAQAIDLAISTFSGRSIEELSKKEGREHAREELLKKIEKAYHHEVYKIYFTEFVMQ